ncbi:MAG: dihydropteroate synthase [Propionibacteriaceae bacterium]|nr:dihydropteroate synthase [Propionibacteriaceae bacterium]
MVRPLIMGVLNVTPDSFSDGGQFVDPETALRHGLQLITDGADVVDVGGESTRPGTSRVSSAIEQTRVLPVIAALRAAVPGASISIDTMRAETARLAVEAGATIVNDVSGGLMDPQMFSTVAELDCDYVCQHWRGSGSAVQEHTSYTDVVREVRAELLLRVDAAVAAGVAAERIIVDPGLGFAKERAHDWAIICELASFTQLGYPVLLGASRKRFLSQPGDTPVERDAATAAVSVIAAKAGMWAVRVHNPAATALVFKALAVCECKVKPCVPEL